MLVKLSLILALLSPLAHADNGWVRDWNTAYSIEKFEQAYQAMDASDYVRYSQQALREYHRRAGTNPPTELEREFLTFRMCAFYLADYQRSGSQADYEKMNVAMRRLLLLPNLHEMSRYCVARVQELSGTDYNPFYIKAPKGQKRWDFLVGGSSEAGSAYILNDFRSEYEIMVKDKLDSAPALALKSTCFLFLICPASARVTTDVQLNDLKLPILLRVWGKDGVISFDGLPRSK